jgi:uncharacterized pyridoxamine 5'-phosphate oxidase family protein
MLLSGDEKTIQDLLQDQKFAVLSTYDSSQPYCNLVAFADIKEGKSIIFITDRNTRKYRNLKKNEKVSLLIDNRTNRNIDFDKAIAVTLMGRAKEVAGENTVSYREYYLNKHPNLNDFFSKMGKAIFEVIIDDYIIASFNKVIKLQPR